jgi:hypothetical protein
MINVFFRKLKKVLDLQLIEHDFNRQSILCFDFAVSNLYTKINDHFTNLQSTDLQKYSTDLQIIEQSIKVLDSKNSKFLESVFILMNSDISLLLDNCLDCIQLIQLIIFIHDFKQYELSIYVYNILKDKQLTYIFGLKFVELFEEIHAGVFKQFHSYKIYIQGLIMFYQKIILSEFIKIDYSGNIEAAYNKGREDQLEEALKYVNLQLYTDIDYLPDNITKDNPMGTIVHAKEYKSRALIINFLQNTVALQKQSKLLKLQKEYYINIKKINYSFTILLTELATSVMQIKPENMHIFIQDIDIESYHEKIVQSLIRQDCAQLL